MTLVYATSSDYSTWSGADTGPDNVDQLLRSASLLVRDATAAAYYQVDTTGLPSDAILLQAFNDATCAQVSAWVAAGIDPNAVGLLTTPIVRAKALDGGSVDYDTSLSASVTAFQARQQIATGLCVEAQRILASSGLVLTAPWIA